MPLVSLNFNKNSLLYSVMHGYYKLTLTGHILGFLDYFLKGFVNGGFFMKISLKIGIKQKILILNI